MNDQLYKIILWLLFSGIMFYLGMTLGISLEKIRGTVVRIKFMREIADTIDLSMGEKGLKIFEKALEKRNIELKKKELSKKHGKK